MGIHRNHAGNKVSAGIFRSFFVVRGSCFGSGSKKHLNFGKLITYAGFYCPIGRGHVPRAIFDCQTMT